MDFARGLRLALDPSQPDVIAIVGGGSKSSAVFRLARDLAAGGRRALVTHTARIAAFQVAWSPAVIEIAPDAVAPPLPAIAAALDAHGTCLLTGPVVGDRRAGLSPHLVDALARAGAALGLHAISVEADGSKMRPAKAPAKHEPVLPDATTLLAPMLGLDAVGGEITERLFHRAELVMNLLRHLQEVTQYFTPAGAAALLASPAGGAKAQPPAARLLPIFNKADDPLRLLYGRLAAAQLAATGQAACLAAVGVTAAEPLLERWGPLATVILAAGAGTRLGRPKPLEPVGGEPLLLRALRLAASQPGPVYVVTGAHQEPVMALLAHLPPDLAAALGAPGASRLQVIHNPDWPAGQATSLHATLRALPPVVEAAIWLPVDQPFLEASLLARLAAAWRQGADLAAPLAGGEVRGAPALFDRRFWPSLWQVQGDRGGRTVLRRHAAEVVTVAVDAAVLRDIDYPEDLPQ